jgi:hypothetical protein
MKLITLSQGYVASVSDTIYAKVAQFKWHAAITRRKDGTIKGVYAARNVVRPDGKRRLQYMHAVIKGTNGVDHRDGNGLNNTDENLRLATTADNNRNRRKGSNKSSQYKGVSWNKMLGKWTADITVNDCKKFLGGFVQEIDAAFAYDVAARLYHGEFAAVNFVL